MYKICKVHYQKCIETNRCIADLFNTDRHKPPKPCNDAIQQVDKGPATSNEQRPHQC